MFASKKVDFSQKSERELRELEVEMISKTQKDVAFISNAVAFFIMVFFIWLIVWIFLFFTATNSF